MVYIWFGVLAFATDVDMARIWRDFRLDIAKSIMDSSDVAQRLLSPAMAGASHTARVFLMAVALSELGLIERRERISGSLEELKGMESAAWRVRSEVPAERVNCSVIFEPGWRFFSEKKKISWYRVR